MTFEARQHLALALARDVCAALDEPVQTRLTTTTTVTLHSAGVHVASLDVGDDLTIGLRVACDHGPDYARWTIDDPGSFTAIVRRLQDLLANHRAPTLSRHDWLHKVARRLHRRLERRRVITQINGFVPGAVTDPQLGCHRFNVSHGLYGVWVHWDRAADELHASWITYAAHPRSLSAPRAAWLEFLDRLHVLLRPRRG